MLFERIIDKLFPLVGILFVLFMLYVLFVVLPLLVYTELQCLEAGYPEAGVTILLDSYCLGIEGATNSHVVPLNEAEGGT